MKKLVLAAGFVLAATSASLAQIGYGAGTFGIYVTPGHDYYDTAPGYGYNGVAPGYGTVPGYGYYGSPPAWYENNTERGGPGSRVGAGSGTGIGSQR